jgi:hypothetical protein
MLWSTPYNIYPKDKLIPKYVKKPSWVVSFNFKDLSEKLHETHMSDNQHENNQLPKKYLIQL